MKRERKKSNCISTIIIRFSSICLIVLYFTCTRVYALDPLGPPVTDIQKWQLTGGVEYSLNSQDIELINGSAKETINGGTTTYSDIIDLSFDNVESDKLNIYFGYGLDRNAEAFVRLGATSSKFGHSALAPEGKFDSDYSPSLGAGLRMTFIDDRRFKIGAIVQGDWAEYNGQINQSQWTSPDNITMDVLEAQIAFGALYQWTDYISFYGGPLYQYLTGEFKDRFIYIDDYTYDVIRAEDNWDIKSVSEFGGYLGTRVELFKNFDLNVEYQMVGNANLLAAGIVFKF
jgi:hypothetical protein